MPFAKVEGPCTGGLWRKSANPSYSPQSPTISRRPLDMPFGSSKGHTLRADLSRYAVNALEVVDPGSRGFAPRRSWPGFLQFERYEAEQLRFRAA